MEIRVEPKKVDYTQLHSIGRNLLEAIGEDPTRPGLVDTPRRFADSWREFVEYDPGNIETTFESVTLDQMVVVKGMRVWSMCEHHLLPFWCDVSVGYLTGDKVLGLSKFARIAHKHAHRLQLQERLVEGIATDLKEIVGTENVAVIAEGEHLCMTMRGVRTPARMISSAMYGAFRTEQARAEFLSIVRS
jgi:GTP cyclohydrolase I